MKKIILFFMIVMMPMNAFAKVKIVASLPVFGAIAQEVGGDRVEITSLAKPGQDPHFLDAKPTYVVALSQADLLLQGGLELEIGWLPPVVLQSRNPKIQSNAIGDVNLSQGIQVLEIPTGKVDRSLGDVHPLGNPHIWLDPRNAKIMAETIVNKLKEVDPQGREIYQKNLADFELRLGARIKSWQESAQKLKGFRVLTYHKSLTYLADWLGVEIVGTLESKPGIPPSSQSVNAVLDLIDSVGIKGLLVESYYPQKIPQYIFEKSKLPYRNIPIDVGEDGTKTYFDLIDKIVTMLLSIQS